MRGLILLVDTNSVALRRTAEVLSQTDFLVAPVCSFQEAKTLLDTISPELLIASLRLDAFNGLQLAVRSRDDHPRMPVILTHPTEDVGLEREAMRYGAHFIVNPLENPAFLPEVKAAIERHARVQRPIRRWQRKQVAGGLEAQLDKTPARICEISYGGFRLAVGKNRPVPEEFDLELPGLGTSVKARSVWSQPSPNSDECWCGAELVDPESASIAGWRDLVDEN